MSCRQPVAALWATGLWLCVHCSSGSDSRSATAPTGREGPVLPDAGAGPAHSDPSASPAGTPGSPSAPTAAQVADAATAGDELAEAGAALPAEPALDAGIAIDAGLPTDLPLDANTSLASTCDTVAPTACPEPATYYADVEPVFESYCLSCHWGEPAGPWPLDSYAHVADWHDALRTVMLNCSMPPPDSGVDMPLAARQLVLSWLRCGYQE